MESGDYDQQSDTYLRDLTIPPAVYLPVGLAILILIVCMCLTAIGCCIRAQRQNERQRTGVEGGNNGERESVRNGQEAGGIQRNREGDESARSWQGVLLTDQERGVIALSKGEEQSAGYRRCEEREGEGSRPGDARGYSLGAPLNSTQWERAKNSNLVIANLRSVEVDSLPPNQSGKLAVSPTSASLPGQHVTDGVSHDQRKCRPKRKVNDPQSQGPSEVSIPPSLSSYPSDQETNPVHRSSIVQATTFDSMQRVRKSSEETAV